MDKDVGGIRRELDFIDVDGFYGGHQEWYRTYMMRLGGCSTASASETCAYLAKQDDRYRRLYPYDPHHIGREDFIRFGEQLYEYIYPRMDGLSKLSLFRDGLLSYASGCGITLSVRAISGRSPYANAQGMVKDAIDAGLCLNYLLLLHQNRAFSDFTWHWFTITGYQQTAEDFMILAATWGQRHWLSLSQLWDTGKRQRGGMLVFQPAGAAFDRPPDPQ